AHEGAFAGLDESVEFERQSGATRGPATGLRHGAGRQGQGQQDDAERMHGSPTTNAGPGALASGFHRNPNGRGYAALRRRQDSTIWRIVASSDTEISQLG